MMVSGATEIFFFLKNVIITLPSILSVGSHPMDDTISSASKQNALEHTLATL